MKIHLGYEIGTGEAIEIPLTHMAVTGQTQASGKTTTLEALISRSGLRALTFVTKRGEGAFADAHQIDPYFRERADWQYVSALLETTLREKLKFERSWIMQVCKGAQSLADVQRNVDTGLEKARGLNQSVLTTLHAYLEIVIPQIEKTRFATSIALSPGVNVMDLADLSLELQSLVIRASLEWIYEREDNTVCLIPEAWEFIPQNRNSPVRLACEQLIRKGGGLKNFLWLDSQDIAAVHNDILRSAQVWILGVQRERNEVKRTLAHMSGAAKPKVDDVMQLGLGEFFVCFGKQIRKVYVQPAWMEPVVAQYHAKHPEEPIAGRAAKGKDFKMDWKKKYEDLLTRFNELSERLHERIASSEEDPSPRSAKAPATASPAPTDIDSIYQQIRTRLMKDPGVIQLMTRKPEIHVTVDRPILKVSEMDGMRGRMAKLIADGFFDEVRTGYAAFVEIERRGARFAKVNVYKELAALAGLGFVTKEGKEGYQKAPDAVIKIIKGANA